MFRGGDVINSQILRRKAKCLGLGAGPLQALRRDFPAVLSGGEDVHLRRMQEGEVMSLPFFVYTKRCTRRKSGMKGYNADL